MPLLQGDIRFARSVNMADVPEGGGPPSAQLLTSGRSNDIVPDISEESRTVGRVEIYQIFNLLRNTDTAAMLGGMGNPKGALVGGILLGVLEALTAGYLSSQYKDAAAFVIILLVLFIMPQGLFGAKQTERV